MSFWHTGIKVLCLSDKKIHIFRDVTSREKVFPVSNFHVSNLQSSPMFDHSNPEYDYPIPLHFQPINDVPPNKVQCDPSHVTDVVSPIHPSSYEEAVMDPIWQSTMTQELSALHDNNTWDLMPLSTGKSP